MGSKSKTGGPEPESRVCEEDIMIRRNVHEAQTHLSRYLTRLAAGETIILCKKNVPIAGIRPPAPSPDKAAPLPPG